MVILLATVSTIVSWKDIGDLLSAAARPVNLIEARIGFAGLGVELTLRFQRVNVPTVRMVALVFSVVVLRGLRWIGLALSGLGFFAAWTAVYMVAWGADAKICATSHLASCSGTFAGLGTTPTIGDFTYLATNVAFFSPPSSIEASSRLAAGLETAEMIMAAGFLATFAVEIGLGLRRRLPGDAASS